VLTQRATLGVPPTSLLARGQVTLAPLRANGRHRGHHDKPLLLFRRRVSPVRALDRRYGLAAGVNRRSPLQLALVRVLASRCHPASLLEP
jgi:hypothetical protein